MGYLIGTDEAGYGPNFGPMVVSATVWHVEGSPRSVDLYRRLSPAVTRDGHGETAEGVVWIADSKERLPRRTRPGGAGAGRSCGAGGLSGPP